MYNVYILNNNRAQHMNMLFALLTKLLDDSLVVCEQWLRDLKNCGAELGYTFTLDDNCDFVMEEHDYRLMELVNNVEVYSIISNGDGTDNFHPRDVAVFRNKDNGNYYVWYSEQLIDF